MIGDNAIGGAAILLGAAEVSEGVENIRLGEEGDVHSPASNFLRDNVFGGDQGLYNAFRNDTSAVATIASWTLISIPGFKPRPVNTPTAPRNTRILGNGRSLRTTNDFAGFRGNIQNVNAPRMRASFNRTRINLANNQSRFTPLRSRSGKPVSAGFNHVVDGHFDRELGNYRSIFSITPARLKSILQRPNVVRSPITVLHGTRSPMPGRIPAGQFVRVVNVGEVIGRTTLKDGGMLTTWIKIITDSKGNLITAYPVSAP